MTDVQAILASLRPPVLLSGPCAKCGDPIVDPPPRDFDCQVALNGKLQTEPAMGVCETCGSTAHDRVRDRFAGKPVKRGKKEDIRLGRLASKVVGKPDVRLNAYLERNARAEDAEQAAKAAQPHGPAKFRPKANKGAKP